MEDFNKEVGARLLALRTRLGMSQEEFGDKLGFSRAMISKYEGGHYAVPILLLQKCYVVFDIDSDFLLGNKTYSIPKSEPFNQIMETLLKLDSEKLLIAKGMLKSSFREVI